MSASRLFVAFELPSSVREDLGRVADRLQRTGARVSWTRPDSMHVTLKFLGDVAVAAIPDLEAALGSLRFEPFDLRVEGLGYFPPRGRPRVLWAGIAGEVAAAVALAGDVDRAVEPLGFDRETRPFQPHVTLGRIRSARGIDDLRVASDRIGASVHSESVSIREVVLFESRLDSTGPRYHARWRSSIPDSNEC